MQIRTKRQGVIPSVRPVPTEVPLFVVPLTADRVGQDPEDIEKDATIVRSLDEAFKRFEPSVDFTHTVQETEFKAKLKFQRIKDFSPDEVLKQETGEQNDLAALHARVAVLKELRSRFAGSKVQRAWAKDEQREEILKALKAFEAEVKRIAGEP